jgi:hypothetical protein
MRTRHISSGTLLLGILSIAIAGCSNSGAAGGNGGAAGGGGSSGGTTGSGGASGGKTGTGGSMTDTGTGGTTGTGGAKETGGSKGTGGAAGDSGGRSDASLGAGGVVGTGGRDDGGLVGGARTDAPAGTGGLANGGAPGLDGGLGTGGALGLDGGLGTGGKTTPTSGTCTTSKDAGKASGSGTHKVVMEMNSDAGIKCGTIYRPQDLGTEKYPIFVWGEGGCSQSGTSNQAAMGEIASHGYFVVADGVVSGTACSGGQDSKIFLDYITWAIAENDKPCSAYYQSLDTAKIAADGFSCGGLMSENVSGDPRFMAIGITSSGLFSADQALYKKIHTPFKILLGGSGDMAYTNGERDYDQISALGISILLLSKDGAGHGGDLSNAKGDFNTVNLAWLNWQLKGDTGATGKALLVGSSCKYCKASGWEYKSKNIE